jgi:pyruvate ferredoxin oxidoreductase alpha subunit
MAIANRALSAPLSIWGDHSDVMASRECGWIQFFAENGQQAFDLTLCAFKVAEDPRVLFPTIVNLDGFNLSHVVEPLYLVSPDAVDKFLPPYRHPYALNPDRPLTMGAFGMPNLYTEVRKSQDVALRASKRVVLEVWKEYGDMSGRRYKPVETYRSEDAETLFLMMGSFSETAAAAIDELRAGGQKVGLMTIRLWRPFPFEELAAAVGTARLLIVMDRAVCLGGPTGPVCSEVQAALYAQASRPRIVSFVAGLGGRDVSVDTFKAMIRQGIEKGTQQQPGEFEMIGVRG